MYCQSMYNKDGDQLQCQRQFGHDGPHESWVFGGDSVVWECCCKLGVGRCGCTEWPSDEK